MMFLGAMATGIAIFGFNFFAVGYSLSDLTTFFLAKDSRVQERLIMQPGTSTGVSIVAGTQTDTWVDNPDDLTLPRIELNGTTGAWGYKNRGTNTATQSFIGSDHTHNGSDSTRVSHADLTGTGTNSHTTIDTFIASKAQASGLASLDANAKVVENPASGTSTPGLNKVVMSDGAGKISDAWLNDTVTKLGTPTADSINEGSTNKYYTDARVNAALGSTSVSAHNDVNFPTTPGNNQVLMYNFSTSQWENNTSSASVNWGAIGGTPNDQLDTLMSQAEAEGGTNTTSKMPSALRLKQAVAQHQGTNTPNLLEVYIGTTTVKKGVKMAGSSLTISDIGLDATAVLLLHANNPGTSTFIDSALTPKTITANGNAIGTSAAKYGTGAAYFDGTGDYLSAADHDDWTWGGSYTAHCWVKIPTSGYGAGSAHINIISQATDANNQWRLLVENNQSGANQGKPVLVITQGGSSYVNIMGTTAIAENTWTHLAWVKNGSTYQVFVNGVGCGTATNATTMNNYTGQLRIGKNEVSVADAQDLNGVIDEVNILKGVALWTSNFTTPTNPTLTKDTVSFTETAGSGNGISIIIGSETTTTARNFELASGQTSLADSWDTRCDPDLKEVVSGDSGLADQAYEQLKLTEIKRWKFKEGGHEVTGVMIDDPNIPEDIIWRLENGQPGGFNGTGFLNFLYSTLKSLITKTEQQKTEIDALKAIVNQK